MTGVLGIPARIDDPLLDRFIVENGVSWFTGAMPPEAR